AREDQSLEAPRTLVGDGQRRDLGREGFPPLFRVDREAGIEPARDDRASAELDAELRRDGDPSLVVHRVPVLAGEHPWGAPWTASAWSAGFRAAGLRSVLAVFPTSHHFGPLRRIVRRDSARVNAEITTNSAGIG